MDVYLSIYKNEEGQKDPPRLEPETAIPSAVPRYLEKCVDMLARDG